jgi:MSHA biogenesis protein MshJ
LGSLQRDMRDPNEENSKRLALLDSELQVIRGALSEHEKLLVSPQDIPALLERLLTRHASLRLISLRTLPTVPANEPEPTADGDKKLGEKDKQAEPVRRNGIDVWKHGVEIRLRGNYADLTAYLTELERLPQRLVWGKVSLNADYPKSELHLKIYSYKL